MAEPCGPPHHGAPAPRHDDGEHTTSIALTRAADGWRASCACGWAFECTSPAIVQRAAERHQAGAISSRQRPQSSLPWRDIAEALGLPERALRDYRREYLRRIEQENAAGPST